MKLSLAAVSSFVAASVAASLPAAFTLVADGGNTVLTDGTNAYISKNGSDYPALDILILHSSNNQVTYTAEDSTPTGWQNLYVIEDKVDPIALTVPHSGATPEGANMTGFGMTDDGYFTFNGVQAFVVDPNAGERQEIYYQSPKVPTPFTSTFLWVKECKGC
ncbi:hypothetical protein ATEIFO6365_0004004800 [Aspergillus terreus]|uniref:Uncharacterized protein n=1 Tax=Aspergillus terreus TaxID=33178 RepID=A0A5M3YSC4_ASPTE|nr:hypothetical protein ATETN484_0002014700 [Aspergillus terreus]GFF14930.1 hypothetical protein ATEIFO6365_0004004800 [Aspergillus terreus]